MSKTKKSDLGYQLGLISFVRPSSFLRNTKRVPTMSPRRLVRAAGVFAGGLVGSPLRLFQLMRHRRTLNDVAFDEAPVFIIGHWRSGTTHLHNLMSQDEQFGCVRMAQALSPDCAVSTRGWLPDLFARVFPQKRPMDNLTWPMDAPQEEEIPLAKMTPYSWYMQFFFPKQALELLTQGVLFDKTPPRIGNEVKRKYLDILKTASYLDGGRRLLLKNPVNTARIPMLLDLFPDAKFVAIHRSPYEVFPSAINLHRKILNLTSLQEFDDQLVEDNVLAIYEQVMATYLADRHLIPAGNLVEVAYADLDASPRDTVRAIYDQLGIAGWDSAQSRVDGYIESQRGYRKNGFSISARSAALVEDRWRFAFDALGYRRVTIDMRVDAAEVSAGGVGAVTQLAEHTQSDVAVDLVG